MTTQRRLAVKKYYFLWFFIEFKKLEFAITIAYCVVRREVVNEVVQINFFFFKKKIIGIEPSVLSDEPRRLNQERLQQCSKVLSW